MKTATLVTIGAIALAALLLPFMLVFDAARPWIALASMAAGGMLLLWASVRRRRL